MDVSARTQSLRRAAGRALRSDFGRDAASAEERAALAAGSDAITDSLAQDYAAWRASVLLMAAVALVIAALLQLFGFETFSDGYVTQAEALAEEQGEFFDEDAAYAQLDMQFGADNVDVLDAIPVLSLLAFLVVVVLAVLAARSWRGVRRSARLARWAWYVLIGAPLGLAILPWSRMLDFSHLDAEQAQAMTSMLGMTLGLMFFFVVAPKLLSIFPGIIRASVTLKTMLHESPVPGYVVVLFAPVYAMFVLVVFTTINQVEGNLMLLVGIALLVVAPLVYLLRARDFLRPHSEEESATLVRAVRRQAYLFNLAGMVLVFVFLLGMENVTVLQVLEFAVTAGGGVLLMMVVASDLVLGLLRLEHAQAKEFVGSELAARFEDKLTSLNAVSGDGGPEPADRS